MKIINNSAIAIPLLFLSTSVLAGSFSIDPMQKITTSVSTNEPNVIAVHNDKITSMTANSGAILSSNKTIDGKVVFTTSAKKNFDVVIETETGFTFTVTYQPTKNSSSPTIIFNKMAKGSDKAISYEEDSQSYSNLITKSLTMIVNNKIPVGFVETRNTSISLPKGITEYLDVKGVNSWNGFNIKIQKVSVKNKSLNTIELNERYLWFKNVMAISFVPNVLHLPPNYTVDAYIVIRGEN